MSETVSGCRPLDTVMCCAVGVGVARIFVDVWRLQRVAWLGCWTVAADCVCCGCWRGWLRSGGRSAVGRWFDGRGRRMLVGGGLAGCLVLAAACGSSAVCRQFVGWSADAWWSALAGARCLCAAEVVGRCAWLSAGESVVAAARMTKPLGRGGR